MDRRMAGDYEVIHAFHIGDKEIVIGENIEADEDERYMCAFCEKNEIMERYSDVIASDDFCEVAKLYADRLSEQAEKTRQANFTPKFQGIDTTPLTEADCTLITADDYVKGKLIVIKQDALRQEYRMSTHQLKICTGGFGSHARSRGSACFCVDLYSGQHSRFEREDVLGTVTEEQLPQWAKLGLERYRYQLKTKYNVGKER